MRRIFSTVRFPHEPAFTVESFAMIATGRPATSAVPVTTPSAGSSGSRLFASAASSTKEPSSTRRAMRSRAKSLPVSAFFAWYFGAPPFSMRVSVSAMVSFGLGREELLVDMRGASPYHDLHRATDDHPIDTARQARRLRGEAASGVPAP